MHQFVSVPTVTGDFFFVVFDHALGNPSGEGVVRIPGAEIRAVPGVRALERREPESAVVVEFNRGAVGPRLPGQVARCVVGVADAVQFRDAVVDPLTTGFRLELFRRVGQRVEVGVVESFSDGLGPVLFDFFTGHRFGVDPVAGRVERILKALVVVPTADEPPGFVVGVLDAGAARVVDVDEARGRVVTVVFVFLQETADFQDALGDVP